MKIVQKVTGGRELRIPLRELEEGGPSAVEAFCALHGVTADMLDRDRMTQSKARPIVLTIPILDMV